LGEGGRGKREREVYSINTEKKREKRGKKGGPPQPSCIQRSGGVKEKGALIR